ncbi:adhesion G protein-coupled receptor E2-like [Chiloscyllium plagiosum]|uniref:adhesion G protein-coupled receptor E2-like n=1 Tax=Chiloscyllium plagiosum TaxID=36176 RepID=UPI001CB88129|nr:adhesion G protein-coupled receptor E2-like [Chiloscyllium plagiosum]
MAEELAEGCHQVMMIIRKASTDATSQTHCCFGLSGMKALTDMDQLHLSILSWITYFGLSLSLLCLLVSIVTFFGCQAIQNINTTIKAHLCLSLFLAELLFLVASSIDTRTVNFILLSLSLWILREKISSLNADVSTIKESRVLTFKAMAQFILLGCFWVFGLFQFKEGTIGMTYLFTILNVLQGIFIFCVYCLLNKQIRREYHKLLKRIYSPQKQEMPQSSSYTMNTSNVMILNTVNEPVTKSEIFWMNSQTEENAQESLKSTVQLQLG